MEHHPILADIDTFVKAHGMAESTFGRLAVGDWKLIRELRGQGRSRPRRVWSDTEEKIRLFMKNYCPS